MPERPSRLETLMQITLAVSKRGTCSRLQVGAIVHRAGRILVTGYNGAPASLPHCDHSCTCSPFRDDLHPLSCPTNQPCTMAQHAERNCIDWAARQGTRLEGSELVTTDTPCAQCAGSIINSGITSVVALRPYRDTTPLRMLATAGIHCSMYGGVI